MKKLFMFLILGLALLGCGNKNEDYIKAVKTMKLYEVVEVYEREIVTIEDLAVFYLHKLTGETFSEVKAGVSYEIIGEPSKNSRIVQASKSGAIVTIPVVKNENKFQVKPSEIEGRFGDKKYNSQDMTIEVMKSKTLKMILGGDVGDIEKIFN
ncbi:MAG: hypothetical protein KGV57_02565 [Fusobacterium sp.]|nr:hypothetical protein [Fusobacterium sp.]